MRWATLVFAMLLAACNDLRDFRGAWDGDRIPAEAAMESVLRQGAGTRAHLAIDDIDAHGIAGRLAVDGLLPEQSFSSLAGAEADAIANMTFAGAPVRVYLAFIPIPDGGGDALAMIALYDERRIEVRLLRGGTIPLYAIFALTS